MLRMGEGMFPAQGDACQSAVAVSQLGKLRLKSGRPLQAIHVGLERLECHRGEGQRCSPTPRQSRHFSQPLPGAVITVVVCLVLNRTQMGKLRPGEGDRALKRIRTLPAQPPSATSFPGWSV